MTELSLFRAKRWKLRNAAFSRGDRVFIASRFPIRDVDGYVTGLAAICTDVTERRRAESALRQSEEHYRNVVEGAIEGLAIHQGGIIRFANQQRLE